MIKVTITKQGTYRSLYISGHSDYSEQGSDIYCAAVSVLGINLINSLEKFTHDYFIYNCSDGHIDLEFNNPLSEQAELLVNSFVLGIQGILEENADYIKLIIKED